MELSSCRLHGFVDGEPARTDSYRNSNSNTQALVIGHTELRFLRKKPHGLLEMASRARSKPAISYIFPVDALPIARRAYEAGTAPRRQVAGPHSTRIDTGMAGLPNL